MPTPPCLCALPVPAAATLPPTPPAVLEDEGLLSQPHVAEYLEWWGHDLSLCSGLAVAAALGARHPFADDAACADDFGKLWRLMGLVAEAGPPGLD